MTGSEVWIERDCSAEKGLRGLVLFWSILVEVPKSSLIGFPSIETFRRFAQYALLFGFGQRRLDDASNARRDLVLHGKDVTEVAVIALGPDMDAGGGVDQLRGDAHSITALAH